MLYVKQILFCTAMPIMHELHVKIDNQAFMLIHVVEQVQLFKRDQPILIASPSESEIVTGEKVVPTRRTILTRLVNSEVPRIRKKCQKFTFGRDGEAWCAVCWYVRVPASKCYFSPQSVFGGCTCKGLNRITCRRTEKIHTEKCKSCAGMHQHMNTHSDVKLMFIIWLVLGKGLSCRSEVMAKGFHG